MTARGRPAPAIPVGLDPVSAGAGFGTLAGLLSLGLPFFTGATVALAALVAVAWAIRPVRAGLPPRARRLGLAAISVGWAAFVLVPPPLGPIRAALLGVSLLPLWWSGGRAAAFGGETGP